jgi:hypothetical protein
MKSWKGDSMNAMKSAIILLLFLSVVRAEVNNLHYDDGKITYVLTEPSDIFVDVYSREGKHKVTIFAGH